MNLLKQKRLEKNMTLEEVGSIVGVGKSTVRKWENGMINNMGRDKIVALAAALDVSPLEILGIEEEPVNYDLFTIYNKLDEVRKGKVELYASDLLQEQQIIKQIPIHSIENSYAAANPATLAYGDSVITEQQFNEVELPKGAQFSIKVKGDSMSDLIPDGAVVFFKKQENIENGEIAIVEVNSGSKDDGIACKKVFLDYENEKIILHSLNEKYDDRVLPADQVRIIGKVLFNK